MFRAVSLLAICCEFAKRPPIGRVPEPAIRSVPEELFLAIPDGLGLLNPPQPLVIGRHDHEQIVKLAQGGANPSVVVGFAPVGEALLRSPQKSGPGLEEYKTHPAGTG